jgi:hypothetical protein
MDTNGGMQGPFIPWTEESRAHLYTKWSKEDTLKEQFPSKVSGRRVLSEGFEELDSESGG